MKKLITSKLFLILCILSPFFACAQLTTITFSGTGALNTNGWTTNSGTSGQLTSLATTSDIGNSLSYSGLPTSTNNRTTTIAGNSEDVNYAVSTINNTGSVYYSALIKVTNTTGLAVNTTTGNFFMTLADTSGAVVTTGWVGRLFVRHGSTSSNTTFNLGVLNSSGGTPLAVNIYGATPVDYAINTTYLVVIKYTYATNTASLWVNPTISATEPTALVSTNFGTSIAPLKSKSIVIRQAGTASAGTGNIEIDEIRVSNNWSDIFGFFVNTISQNQTICYGKHPNRIDGSSNFFYNSTYRWIQSTTSSNLNFSQVSGNNNTQNYQPSNLYQTTWFKRISQIGAISDTSNAIKIEVLGKPVSKFNVSNLNQCINKNQFNFLDSSFVDGAGLITNYKWEFGDGTISNLKNPTKSYTNSGVYLVKLIIFTNLQCTDTSFITLNVFVNQRTFISSINNSQCLQGNSFNFSDSSQISSGVILSRVWSFGDSTQSTLINPTKSYTNAGRYQVKLVTLSDNGCKDSSTKTIIVLNNTISQFSVSSASQCLNSNEFAFKDSSFVDTLYNITYRWDFGDGTFSSNRNPVKKYNNYGNYIVKLTVTSNNTCSDSTQKNIIVYDKQSTNIILTNSTQCLTNNLFSFLDGTQLTNGTIATWIWDFGDGTKSNLTNPIKSYSASGVYNIKLTTITNNGCLDSTTKIVTIKNSPTSGKMAGLSNNIQVNTPYLYNISQQLNHTYNWIIDNGAIVSGQGTNAVTVQWLSNGQGSLKCVLINSENCTDTSVLKVNIGPTGINNIKNSNIKIYPNPTNNIINIEGLNKNENNNIQIFDMQGKLVITKTFTEKVMIDLSELNKGVYVIKIGEVAQRIVKM
jgi:PKD repeat protein